MQRQQVTNGCSGSCCEKFTLPVSINDLKKMKEEYEVQKSENKTHSTIKLEDGYNLNVNLDQEEQTDKLLDMLIPLGVSTIDPQYLWNISEHFKFNYDEWLISFNGDREKLKDYFVEYSRGHIYLNSDNLIETKVFTCKYFDINNKVCLNYENRPDLCKSFGKACGYSGCGYKVVNNLVTEHLISDFEDAHQEILNIE